MCLKGRAEQQNENEREGKCDEGRGRKEEGRECMRIHEHVRVIFPLRPELLGLQGAARAQGLPRAPTGWQGRAEALVSMRV